MDVDFTAPSFSLGIDFDEDDNDLRHPARSHRHEQARREAVPDAPSFSLGIDDDDDNDLVPGAHRREQGPLDAGPQAPSISLSIDDDDDDDDDDDFLAGGRHHKQARAEAASDVPSFSLGIDEDEDDDFLVAGVQRHKRAPGGTLDLDPLRPEAATTRFKRLRRGPAPPSPAPTPPPPVTAEASPVVDRKAEFGAIGRWEDDIEEFSEEERPARDIPPSVGSCSISRSSKFSLWNHGVLTSQSTSKTEIPKFTEVSNASTLTVLEESCTKKVLPKITISPMRKILLLDSDSESDNNKNVQKAIKPVSPPKKKLEVMQSYIQKKPALQQNSKPQDSTLLQKRKAQMNESWATPALDEFCEDYFRFVKDSKPHQQKEELSSVYRSSVTHPNYSSNSGAHFQQQCTSSIAAQDDDLTDTHPPSKRYFFHHDPMVRKLVRDRLQHFVPIGAESTRENEQVRAENLNYTSEFGPTVAASAQWVTPNRRTSIPTDFGKRRVHASGSQSGSGHWFTGEDGRKVYVSKNGQELTGRIAYRQYRKESGNGFRKPKKKCSIKKEGSTGAKRGSTRAKKVTAPAKQGATRVKRKR